MSNASSTRKGLHGPRVDPFKLIAAVVGLVALGLLGVGIYAALTTLGVTIQPTLPLVSVVVSIVLVLAVAGVVVLGRKLNGRPRPEVHYHR